MPFDEDLRRRILKLDLKITLCNLEFFLDLERIRERISFNIFRTNRNVGKYFRMMGTVLDKEKTKRPLKTHKK